MIFGGHIHEIGNLIEFMAVGTAIKRFPGVTTLSDALPAQAIIKDKDTWVSDSDNLFNLAQLTPGSPGVSGS